MMPLESVKLSPRWWPMKPHAAGEAYTNSPHRFNTVPAGRRSTKTERFKRKVVSASLNSVTTWVPRFFAAAPTRDQAKRIFWDDLKALVGRGMMLSRPSESDLMIRTLTGAEIWVIGLDKPQRMEGQPWDGGGVTEFANVKDTAWAQNIRPALSDRNGWCDLEGVPEGRNHYYDLDLRARAQMVELGVKSPWGSFTWPSRDILPPEEIAEAMRDLDELTFQQEYEASFISFEGRAYYVFTSTTHCAPLAYNPKAPLSFCFDFNVEPGVCAIVQEQVLPGQFEHALLPPLPAEKLLGRPASGGAPLLDRPITGTGVIGEVHIPRNSNTPAVCRAILKTKDGGDSVWSRHQGPVRCYGDATGGARGTAKVDGSDWELIEKALRPVFKDRLALRVKTANPAERARINALNSRMLSATKDVRLLVDPTKAPHVVKDLEGVVLLKGGSGEIDKKATPLLTHLSDGLGYYVECEFPVNNQGVVRMEVIGV